MKSYIKRQSKTELIRSMKYFYYLEEKIRSKILIDVGRIFNLNYRSLIKIGAAVECIHAYSLIHDDLPCMDNDSKEEENFLLIKNLENLQQFLLEILCLH